MFLRGIILIGFELKYGNLDRYYVLQYKYKLHYATVQSKTYRASLVNPYLRKVKFSRVQIYRLSSSTFTVIYFLMSHAKG